MLSSTAQPYTSTPSGSWKPLSVMYLQSTITVNNSQATDQQTQFNNSQATAKQQKISGSESLVNDLQGQAVALG